MNEGESIMNKKRFYTGKNQDGVALIFALAMLALLLIMLIGFLASSILEQRIAYSYRDDVGSRLLVRSALVRVKSLLKASDEYPDDLLYMRAGAPEVSGKPDIIAPIVSMTSDAERTTGEPSGNDTAYKALKPLLKKYFGPNKAETADDVADKWEWTNFFPSNVSMFYPNWIYYYSDPQATGNNRRITGRMAYVAVPNMGINLSLLKGEGTERLGKEFAELSSEAFLTNSGKNTLNRFANWLSVDVLMGGDGLYRKENETSKIKFDNVDEENFHSGKLGAKIEGSTSDWGKEKAFSTLFLTTSESGFVSNGHKFDIAKFSKSGGAVKLFESYTSEDTWRDFFSTNFDLTGDALSQVAANAKDYVDADHLPSTSLGDLTDWKNETPTYAGNEKTPYINQIVPAFEVKADYTVTSVRKNVLQTTYTQKVNFTVKGKVFAELINIYSDAPEGKGVPAKLVLKNLTVKLNRTAQIGRVVAGLMVPTGTNIPNAEITLTADTVELPVSSVSAKSYATFNNDDFVTFSGSIPALSVSSDHVTLLGCPTLDVSFDLAGVEFDRAVLVNSDNEGLDFVGKLELDGMPKQFIGRSLTTNPETNMPQMNTDNAWEFGSSDISKTARAHVNFEVADPRFNLASDQWKSEWQSEMSALTDAVPSAFDFGQKNSDAEAANDKLTEEKDLETDNDPVKLSTAYIRNAPMQSLSELGLIHRAKPWQTFNLRSTPADPDLTSTLAVDAKLSYLNDAIILERYLMKLDEPTMNVNYPANMTGALAPLTTNLKYRAYRADDTASELSADAQKELRSWLANKCYQASSNDPKSDSSEKYNRYVRRSEMVNVITDWALNGNKSPWKGKGSDAALEEIVARIVPHVRFGEMFEYYTVFAVAQTIKDMGGTVYRNDANGKLKKFDNAKFGEMDENDIITSETFLVARLRRTISCKNEEGKYNKSCLWGRHQKGCTKTITVLESYTLNMD